jgi:hypothetical protein
MMFDTNQNAKSAAGRQEAPDSLEIPCFDDLVALYKRDVEAFEQLRIRLIEQLILSAPERMQKRLRGLQFQVEMERRKARTPLGACIRLSQMMRESMLELEAVLCNPAEFLRTRYDRPEATVIPFCRTLHPR